MHGKFHLNLRDDIVITSIPNQTQSGVPSQTSLRSRYQISWYLWLRTVTLLLLSSLHRNDTLVWNDKQTTDSKHRLLGSFEGQLALKSQGV